MVVLVCTRMVIFFMREHEETGKKKTKTFPFPLAQYNKGGMQQRGEKLKLTSEP